MEPVLVVVAVALVAGWLLLRGVFWFADRAGRRAEAFVGGKT